MADRQPWHGVIVASALPFTDSLAVDHQALGAHVQFLAAQGCQGVAVNGSLGEYQVLTDAERAEVVRTAVAAAPAGFDVMAGVGAYGSAESRSWAEQAASAGATSVLCLPPIGYRADERSVLAHYREVAAAGLPVVAYNNPYDTRVDLVPEVLARLHGEGLIVGVKEFSGDPRRVYRTKELAAELDVLIGADDTVLEVALAGASGWIAGYTNAFPALTVRLYEACMAGDLAVAVPMYRALHPLLRWDTTTEFVQAIKLSMDMVGLRGGGCRPPRQPLLPEQEAQVRAATEAAIGWQG